MERFIQRTINWIIGIGLAIFLYGRFCDWFFVQTEYLDVANNKRAWNVSHKKKEYDFAVLGNSRAYGVFDMHLLEQQFGKKGINLGAPGSGFVDNYLTLNLLIKNGTRIKTIFLQVDLYSLNSKLSLFTPFHKYHFVQYWDDKIVQNTILDYSSNRETRLLSMFPELRYVKFNKYFSPKEIVRRALSSSLKSGFDKTLGARITYPTKTIPANHVKAIGNEKNFSYTFDKKDFEYLEKLLFLCRTHDIKVVAFRSPEFAPQTRTIDNYAKSYATVGEFLARYKIPYIADPLELEENPKYFYEGIHLNKFGIIPYTNAFVNMIQSKHIEF